MAPASASARAFALAAARLAAQTRCHQVTVLDVSGLSPVCDYLVLATGTSARQMHTVADEILELGKSHDYPDFSHSGYAGDTWVCLDFIDLVVHLFNQEARMYYDLDGLWGDAPKVDWEAEAGAETPATTSATE